jgi:hypothetical protein
MATGKNYDMTVYPVQAAVRSASDGAAVHLVTLPHCDCADFTNRRGILVLVDKHTAGVTVCKHIAEALTRIGGWNRPEPVVYSDRTRQQARAILLGAGQSSREITALLNRIQVHHGKDSFRSAGPDMPAGEVTYDMPSGRYTITFH